MPSAFILNNVLTTAEQTQINSTLGNSGFSPVYIVNPNVANININSDIVVLLMPADKSEAISVETAIGRLGPAGVRVIGFWLCGSAGARLPNTVSKYGYSALCFNSIHIDNALKGIAPVWENSNCDIAPIDDIPRNRC